MGIDFFDQKNNEKALNYFKKSLKIYKKVNTDKSLNNVTTSWNYYWIGVILRLLKNFKEGLTYLNKSLEIMKLNVNPSHKNFVAIFDEIAGVYFD